ncbi:MAG: hypothetical protein Q8P18_19375 [Pseudomonadota bacterium]|nr:hypothetical protein [Pseudomonadota bacterium]
MRLLPLFLLACTGVTKDDTGVEPADTDTDTDADSDTDTDTDTDTDPRDATISGMVVFEDGSPVPGIEVQVCSTVCRYTETDAAGNFTQGGLEGARFKVDAIGATYTTPGFGNALFGVDLGISEDFTIPAPMVVPPAEGPEVANEASGAQTYVLGDVSLTFTASSLDMPFGVVEDNGDFNVFAGVLEGASVPALWSVAPAFTVGLLPWGSEPSAPMDIVVTGLAAPDGTYDVYALEEYGAVEGPLGTATVTGGTATAAGLLPQVWTWLMFVPA